MKKMDWPLWFQNGKGGERSPRSDTDELWYRIGTWPEFYRAWWTVRLISGEKEVYPCTLNSCC